LHQGHPTRLLQVACRTSARLEVALVTGTFGSLEIKIRILNHLSITIAIGLKWNNVRLTECVIYRKFKG
jgi:hypothetical protein